LTSVLEQYQLQEVLIYETGGEEGATTLTAPNSGSDGGTAVTGDTTTMSSETTG